MVATVRGARRLRGSTHERARKAPPRRLQRRKDSVGRVQNETRSKKTRSGSTHAAERGFCRFCISYRERALIRRLWPPPWNSCTALEHLFPGTVHVCLPVTSRPPVTCVTGVTYHEASPAAGSGPAGERRGARRRGNWATCTFNSAQTMRDSAAPAPAPPGLMARAYKACTRPLAMTLIALGVEGH
ncbi:hypothetical protein EVAR_49644_1 [Eumeta japonica]|uniref:Uncharacterized protein n=1 Tax=Eumeta variegata TaxID=151549 RepID=A0A4C1YBQ4_EUMVA|nr:hypothetical protein EVAR_49644_1 [Eumeta japonica]